MGPTAFTPAVFYCSMAKSGLKIKEETHTLTKSISASINQRVDAAGFGSWLKPSSKWAAEQELRWTTYTTIIAIARRSASCWTHSDERPE
jgi:hypothetical protein